MALEMDVFVPRFTEGAREVMTLAEHEARRFDHEYIGTEHILLGLIQQRTGIATKILKGLNVDVRDVWLEVEMIVQTGPDGDRIAGRLPHTPRAKTAIECGVEAARVLDQSYVGTEHLLLGLLQETEGVAAQVLINMGLSLDTVRAAVEWFVHDARRWRTSDVVGLARGIAEDQAFDRLPILADALLEAGCEDDEILGHLRRGAAHGCASPGCWVLDRLLGASAQGRRKWVLWG
jgi:ATP-dependent Clp protease ATP-binding subunit ClpA